MNGVTVHGGVKILSTGHLSLRSSTVDGGIVVDPGGELDINATTSGGGTPTFTSSTVHGQTTGTSMFDVDIWTASFDGGIDLNGVSVVAIGVICGNTFNGDSNFSNFINTSNIGGGIAPNGFPCGSNTFHGTVTLTNMTTFMGGNTIHGDLLCTNAAVIVIAPNAITGKNTCY